MAFVSLANGIRSYIVATPLFHSSELHQCSDRHALVDVTFYQHLTPKTYAPPLADEARSAEQIALHAHPVEAPHVAYRINPAHLHVGWKDIKLD